MNSSVKAVCALQANNLYVIKLEMKAQSAGAEIKSSRS